MEYLIIAKKQIFYCTIVFSIISFPVLSQNFSLKRGTFDGKIENDRIILVSDTSKVGYTNGFFIINRGNAVEESYPFSINNLQKSIHFNSGLYAGKLKVSNTNPDKISGKISLLNRKKIFFFFRPKAEFELVLRKEIPVITTDRYKSEIFSDYEVKSDLLYGKAKGYWTSSPYSDEPYISTLGKGLIKSFKDQTPLDLLMDIYYPKTDLFKNRPLVMLIHGGAFYIGSKESAAEKALAGSLAKRGYVVASIDYRLGFKLLATDIEMSGYRALQDAHSALRFLSHNAKGLGINPDQIYVGGTSAGAVASLNVAFMDNDELPPRIQKSIKENSVGKIEDSGNKYDKAFGIKAVANLWGAVSDLNIIDNDEKVSVISIHGTADDIVPYEYDFPFKNSLMINRLIMDKMYGSKPIHDRLQFLGNRNRLISLVGLKHEPELEDYKTLNHYMDTITFQVSKFFYEETAPEIKLPSAQLQIPMDSKLKPFYYEVNNGDAVSIEPVGGLKANSNPIDASVIWFKNTPKKEITIKAKNSFEAWIEKSFPVSISD